MNSTPITVWAIFGTRPEAIKMLPVVIAMKKDPRFNPVVCVTAQHREMLDQVMDTFGVKADIDLNIMTPGQSLTELTNRILTKLSLVLQDPSAHNVKKPDRILVHGDTTTSFVAALAGYYEQIPVGHVEAGLRTNNIYSPFPEEGNRQLTKVLADLHFAPTPLSANNLRAEGVAENKIVVTGNTVVDALFWMKEKLLEQPELADGMNSLVDSVLSKYKNYILVTGHRRESHGDGFKRIALALRKIAIENKDTAIVYPLHPNPKVSEPIEKALSDIDSIVLIKPQDYAPFIHLMMHCKLILTDSGGVQEEAPSLGKPVLVMRDLTERLEAIDAGTVKLVGSDKEKISSNVEELLNNDAVYKEMSAKSNPYGDGLATNRILDAIADKHFKNGDKK